MNKPIPLAICERVLTYLARVKQLRVYHGGYVGEPWPILAASLSVRGPLLPNLNTLCVTFYAWDHIESQITLLSPSLKTLVIECKRSPKLGAIVTFMNLAKARGCDLRSFTFIGATGCGIPGGITLFNNLEEVRLPIEEPFESSLLTTIVQFLRSLPSLRLLSCHIGSFLSPSKEELFCHTNLKKITFRSDCRSHQLAEVFHKCTFPSVTNATLQSYEPLSLDIIRFKSSCPDTQELNLRFKAPYASLNFNHLGPLLSLCIRSFTLSVLEHTLTQSNLRSFAEAWPNIHFLQITSETLFDPLPSLTTFSIYPCLKTLIVPLSLARLLEDISEEHQDTIESRGKSMSPLCMICLKRWGPVPLPTAGRRVIVEHLLRLFPSLVEVQLGAGYHHELWALENIFEELGIRVRLPDDY